MSLDPLWNTLAAIFYRYRRFEATGKQSDHLPSSYSEYHDHKKTYGVAPGDAITINGNPAIVTSIDGPPTINATVEYVDLEEDVEYTTGLGNVMRQL